MTVCVCAVRLVSVNVHCSINCSFIDLDDRFNALTMTSHLKASSEFREVTLTFYSLNTFYLFDIIYYII